MFWASLVILVVLWVLDMASNNRSSLVRALLVIAVGLLLYNLFSERRVAL